MSVIYPTINVQDFISILSFNRVATCEDLEKEAMFLLKDIFFHVPLLFAVYFDSIVIKDDKGDAGQIYIGTLTKSPLLGVVYR